MYAHAGMDGGWWVSMMVFWVALTIAVLWTAFRLLSRRGTLESAGERPEEILDRRLASGEIDVKTFDQLRSRLGGSSLVGGN